MSEAHASGIKACFQLIAPLVVTSYVPLTDAQLFLFVNIVFQYCFIFSFSLTSLRTQLKSWAYLIATP